MRTLFLILIAGMITWTSNGQVTAPQNYFLVSAGYGLLSPATSGHSFVETFNYTATPDGGSATPKVFSAAVHQKFASLINIIDILNVEYVRKHNSFDFGIGVNDQVVAHYTGSMQLGYRYILPIGGLLLKPGVDVYYLEGGYFRIDTINDNHRALHLPGGYTTHDQFTVSSDDGDGGTTDETYDADHVAINYRRNVFLVSPKLVLSTKPERKLILSLEAGWMIQFAQTATMQYEQEDVTSKNTTVLGKVSLPTNGNLSGLYVAAHIGVWL